MTHRSALLASLSIACASVALPACLGGSEAVEPATGAIDAAAPSWDSLGMLLAASKAPVAQVARALGLDELSAKALARFRLGRDQRPGTADDGQFDSVEALVRETGASDEALTGLVAWARANGYVVEHPFPPALVGQTLHATAPEEECVGDSWQTVDGHEVWRDSQAATDVSFRVGYAGGHLTAEILGFDLPGPAWVNTIAHRPGTIVVPFNASEQGQQIWDASVWGAAGDYLEVDVSLDPTGVRFYFEVQCGGSETCPGGGSETYCHPTFALDAPQPAACEPDHDDAPGTANELPATTDPVEATAFDLLAHGAAASSSDADWYRLQFRTEYENCYSCFLPYASLRIPEAPAASPFGMEVCVFVDRSEIDRRGPAWCEGGTATTEGNLTGCCRTDPGPDGYGGTFDVGEAVLWNEWVHHAGESSTMVLRVRPTGAAECVPYELVYGHFRG